MLCTVFIYSLFNVKLRYCSDPIEQTYSRQTLTVCPMCCFVVCAETMLSLTRAVVAGVARAPAAVCPAGVTAITRYNSTAQVIHLRRLCFKLEYVFLYSYLVELI